MYTIDDIDDLFPGDEYGTLYRDLYKDYHGEWPRDLVWESPEDFLEEFDRVLEDDWSDSTAIEEEEDNWTILGDEDSGDLLDDLGYDRRMNRDDEWD